MNIIRKVKTMLFMPSGNKLLLAEAVFTSAWVRFSLSYMPWKIVSRWLGTANVHADIELVSEHRTQITKTHHTLKLCDKYTPWKTECYTLALTGKILLRRRNIPSTLYIGFKKNEAGKYEGHAWLKTATGIVTGNMDLTQFQVHSFFS